MRFHAPAAATALFATLLSACGGESPLQPAPLSQEPEIQREIKVAPSFYTDIQEIIERRGCGNAICHAAGQGGLYLGSDPDANYRALVNVRSNNQREFLRVEPYDAENSYVIMLFENRQSPLFPPMPDTPLDNIDLANFRRWIDLGAALN